MAKQRKLEQHIAVFGESGSGKTVLLSSFYGATQEPSYLSDSPFNVVADDIGQGSRLHRNYLGMRDRAEVPEPTRFSATKYSFALKLKPSPEAKPADAQRARSVQLVWHDYPGEWFEQGVSGEEEASRRVDTFRSLLVSDVALVLVDGQRLLDNPGDEARYLKSLFGNLRNGLLALKDELLDDGRPLIQFPRIWIVALSKADLMPDIDVFGFRDLIVTNAADEVEQLREVVAGFVQAPEALSVGEDFMLLSSADFEVGAIDVSSRIGVGLIIPIAAMLPFERHMRWASAQELPRQVADNLLDNAGPIAVSLLVLGQRIPKVGPFLRYIPKDLIHLVAGAGGNKVKAMNVDARSKKDNIRIALSQMRLDLDQGEEARVLLRSRR